MLKKYMSDFSKKYINDKNIIIESFIEYYGENYRDKIISRINNLNIICYVPLMFHDSLMPKDLLNYLDRVKKLYATNSDVRVLIENLVVDYDCKELLEFCKNNLGFNYLLQSCSLYELNLTILPIVYNLSHITHELNHTIINNILADEPDVSSNGLEISIRDGNKCIYQDTIFNEILCERVTHDVQKIQKSKGLDSEICVSWQYNYFKFIERFYQTFKEIYKYSVMSGNLNALINSVGEQNYRDLVNIVTYLRNEEEKQKKPLDDEVVFFALKQIDEVVDDMIRHYNEVRNKELNKNEMDKYISDKGYKKLSLNNYYILPEIRG